MADDHQLKDIVKPHPHDVIGGRGGATYKHPGNVAYRYLVQQNKLDYMSCKKSEKIGVSKSIVDAIRGQDPSGRFLEKDAKTGLWNDIGDKKAIEKTSQALREGQPDIRRKLEAIGIEAPEDKKTKGELSKSTTEVSQNGSQSVVDVDKGSSTNPDGNFESECISHSKGADDYRTFLLSNAPGEEKMLLHQLSTVQETSERSLPEGYMCSSKVLTVNPYEVSSNTIRTNSSATVLAGNLDTEFEYPSRNGSSTTVIATNVQQELFNTAKRAMSGMYDNATEDGSYADEDETKQIETTTSSNLKEDHPDIDINSIDSTRGLIEVQRARRSSVTESMDSETVNMDQSMAGASVGTFTVDGATMQSSKMSFATNEGSKRSRMRGTRTVSTRSSIVSVLTDFTHMSLETEDFNAEIENGLIESADLKLKNRYKGQLGDSGRSLMLGVSSRSLARNESGYSLTKGESGRLIRDENGKILPKGESWRFMRDESGRSLAKGESWRFMRDESGRSLSRGESGNFESTRSLLYDEGNWSIKEDDVADENNMIEKQRVELTSSMTGQDLENHKAVMGGSGRSFLSGDSSNWVENASLSTQAINEIAGLSKTEGNLDGFDIKKDPYFN